ncbi:hypothetical protein Pmani_011279 [Petrolisthes manimaculis]|uniref:Uncharacterized protein n=1 Tax=Petrolisthes manimaculis TaxID=1843537 RepID=A0AAE1UBP4_9EUCA|nr:hypothetical protein Pmani_011279 [Petrolisthes manimaculis]
MGRNASTIKRLKAAARVTHHCNIPPRKHGSGHPRKITKETDAILRRGVLKNHKITFAGLKKMHPGLLKDESALT